ncbi:hypothetical protein NX059_012124 [Plenodomus lindquistii]|nr:hypothetical protein NX059_012142 [Plenodomus lindquistii]KAI8930754.1 hypothetical protein NX059_012362 [Plenodomus lindquistii]KAI8931114.1 hypothetical protein NX059_012124 [Plenodomus lindquistii]
MREQIRDKSLTELEELMIAYALELGQEGRAEDTPAAQEVPAHQTRRRSVRDFFGQRGQGSARGSTASQAGTSSHSSFRPSSESGR